MKEESLYRCFSGAETKVIALVLFIESRPKFLTSIAFERSLVIETVALNE